MMNLTRKYKFILLIAGIILWWIDIQIIPASSFYRAFIISLSHLYTLILASGVIGLAFFCLKPVDTHFVKSPDRKTAVIQNTHLLEPQKDNNRFNRPRGKSE